MSNFIQTLIFEHNLAVTLQRNGINPPNRNPNLERFKIWMRDRVKSKFITNEAEMNKAYLKIE
jgi:hypothetical protein